MAQPEEREIFCVLGLLRSPDRADQVASVLPEPERSETAELLQTLKSLGEKELKTKLADLMRSAALRAAGEERACFGRPLDGVPPRLRRWVMNQVRSIDGRENHQGAIGG